MRDKEKLKKWKEKNKDRIAEYKKLWRERNPEKVRKHKRTGYLKNREKLIRERVEYCNNNKEIQSAHAKIYSAVKLGRIKKPKDCSACLSESDNIQGHHKDYAKPLEVEWLCPKCHSKCHSKKNLKNMNKILTLRRRRSSVSKYRIDPLIDNLNANVRTELLRKNDKKTIEQLAEKFRKLGNIWVIKYVSDFHTLDVLHSMKKIAKAKIVVDIDDNVWQIPTGNISKGSASQFVNRGIMMTQSVSDADWVTVSTEPLKTALEPLNSNIVVLPNYIIPSEWEFKRKKHDKVRIAWVWSPTHIPDMAEVEGALKKIQKKYGDKVEIIIMGTAISVYKDLKTTNIPGVPYTEYPKLFTELGIDISIAPLERNAFNAGKSNIKWLESTMAGAAFIGSKVYPYEFSVKDGKTGYIADNESQWVRKLSFLIENEEKRAEMVKNATKEVLEDYTSFDKWDKFYQCI
jgi:glycosyltransferase involved in cell wall biosynthesis